MTTSKIASECVPSVFNGDFAFANSGNTLIPGWELHGGGGESPSGGFTASYLQLSALGPDRNFRSHNPMYVPRNTVAIEFDYWIINNVEIDPDDRLYVLLDDHILDNLLLDVATDGFVRRQRSIMDAISTDRVMHLLFRIEDTAGNGIDSAVRIDNVRFVVQSPAPSADFDGDGVTNGSDFLAWQRGVGTYLHATVATGDADGDGNVLASDLAIWKMSFGQGLAQSASTSYALGEIHVAAVEQGKSRFALEGDVPFAMSNFHMQLFDVVFRRESVIIRKRSIDLDRASIELNVDKSVTWDSSNLAHNVNERTEQSAVAIFSIFAEENRRLPSKPFHVALNALGESSLQKPLI